MPHEPAAAPTTPRPPTTPHPRAARRPYALTPVVDAAVFVAGAATWILPEYMLTELVPVGRCPCDPAVLNALDRPVAGLRVPGTGPVSNAATAVLLALPSAIDIFDVWRSGGTVPEWIEATLVIGQSLVVSGAVNEVSKIAFQRPRPQAYGIDPWDTSLGDSDTYLSFYSLSASVIFTGAVAGSVTYALRHPHGPGRWI